MIYFKYIIKQEEGVTMFDSFHNILILEILFIFLLTNIFPIIKEVHIIKRKMKEHSKFYNFLQTFAHSNLKYNILSIYCTILLICIFFGYPDNFLTANNDELSEKINTISSNLKETATELTNVQQQLESRIEYVENLKEEAEIAENVISLSEEQVNAVQSKINQELNANSGKNTMITFLISALFFALGLIVQPIVNFFKRKNGVYIDKNIEINQYNKEELLNLLNEAKNMLESNNETLPKK